MAIGPSMANVLEFYGDRKVWGLSVSTNPHDRKPVYQPVTNPDLAIREGTIQYIVWDAYSGDRSKPSSERLLRYVDKYRGRLIHEATCPGQRRARDPDLRGTAVRLIAARRVVAAGALLAGLAVRGRRPRVDRVDRAPTTPIKHFVSVMQENALVRQLLRHRIPRPTASRPVCACPRCRRIGPACVKPFAIGTRPASPPADTDRAFDAQYADGAMNGFVTAQSSRGVTNPLPMGHYDARALPYYWSLAKNYVLFDRLLRVREGREPPEPPVLGRRRAGRRVGRDGARGRIRRSHRRSSTGSTPRASRGSSTSRTTTRRRRSDAPAAHSRPGRAGAAARVQPLPRRSRALTSHIVPLDQYYEDLARRHAARGVVHRRGRVRASSPRRA